MLCIFIETPACENERISEYLKILNIITRKIRLKKVSFLPKDKKVSKKTIF